jgi:hypothetical protein
MKKLILLLAVVFAFAISANAQHAAKLGTTQTYWNPTIVAADTISGTAVLSYTLDINSSVPTTQSIYVKLDSISTSGVSAQLYGKTFTEEVSFTAIGSPIVWKGTGSDTAFVIANSTAVRYRYISVGLTGTASNVKSKVLDIQFKIWKE